MTPQAQDTEVWAIVPIKCFAAAKQRLAGRLAPEHRKELASAMAEDVLEELRNTTGLDGVLVVTSDPEAEALARISGVHVLLEAFDQGLNAAIANGIRYLESKTPLRAVLIAPSDIPFATHRELSGAVAALAHSAIVLAKAARDNGTNLLGLSPPHIMPPAFGDESFLSHVRSAHEQGVACRILNLAGAAHDIDLEGDLVPPRYLSGGRNTRAYLRTLEESDHPAFREYSRS